MSNQTVIEIIQTDFHERLTDLPRMYQRLQEERSKYRELAHNFCMELEEIKDLAKWLDKQGFMLEEDHYIAIVEHNTSEFEEEVYYG